MNSTYFEIIAFFYGMKDVSLIKEFRKNFFTEATISSIFDTVKDFVAQYRVEPSLEQVCELVKVYDTVNVDNVKMLWQNREHVGKYEDSWLRKSVTLWAKYRSFYTGLESTIAYVSQIPQTLEWNDCEPYIEKATQIFNHGATFSVNVSEGHDFFDPTNHVIPATDTHTTGYKFLDLCLNGGFTKKGLYVFMGAPKVGKSMWLCNLAAESVKNGYDTIYITLEMSYQLVSQRIGANLFGIPISEYNRVATDANLMREKMRSFYATYGALREPGKLIIEEFPTSSATANDIEVFVLRKEEEMSRLVGRPFKFKNVMIDYVNIMKDQRSSTLSDNSYQKIKNICEDVRAMAQRNMWAVVSLTQTNRSGQEATDLNMTNVSESTGLVATVDALFGIIMNNLMRASHVYYIKALALRNSPHMGDKKQFIINPEYLRLVEGNDPILSETEDVPEQFRSATANAMIKQKGSHPTAAAIQQTSPAQMEMPVLGASLQTAETFVNTSMESLFG